MPYRLSDGGDGNTVMKKEGGRWVKVKTHPTHSKALAHLRALQINVEHKGPGAKKG